MVKIDKIDEGMMRLAHNLITDARGQGFEGSGVLNETIRGAYQTQALPQKESEIINALNESYGNQLGNAYRSILIELRDRADKINENQFKSIMQQLTLKFETWKITPTPVNAKQLVDNLVQQSQQLALKH